MKAAVVTILLLLLLAVPASAAQAVESDPAGSLAGAADDVLGAAPDGARDAIRSAGGDASEGGLRRLLSFDGILDMLTNGLVTGLRGAVRDMAVILAVVVVFVLVSSLKESFQSEMLMSALTVTATVAVSLSAFTALQSAYTDISASIQDLVGFMSVMTPVMATAIISTGAVVSGGVLPPIVMLVVQSTASLNAALFLPLINVYMALALVGAVTKRINITGVLKFIKSFICWGMGIVLTVVVGVLSLQKYLAGASDSVAGKAAKFAIGSFVPVVGGILKDAMDTVMGAMGVIKSTVGVLAIVVIIMAIVPLLIRAAAYKAVLAICGGVSRIADDSALAEFLANISSVWSVLLAIIAVEGLMLVVSTAILLTVGVPH